VYTEHHIAAARARVAALRAGGRRLALVPTMGALHDGHLALVRLARQYADTVVASVFVNPLQFGVGEDYATYPRTLEADAQALTDSGTALLFAPLPEEMYPNAPAGTAATTVVPGHAADEYEGRLRPGHFAGVLTVVSKLLHIVMPDVVAFGQKDLQQVAVVRAMLRDLNQSVELVVGETVREPDGVAMSSRNRRLSAAERAEAPRLYLALSAARRAARETGEAEAALSAARTVLDAAPALHTDYLAVVNRDSFMAVTLAREGDAIIGAARLGSTRILDNIII